MSGQQLLNFLGGHKVLSTRTESGATTKTQETTTSDGDWEPSSQASSHIETPSLSQEVEYTPMELARLHEFDTWREVAENRLNKLPVIQRGWCELVDMATNKSKRGVPIEERVGYIQLSWNGLNHVSSAHSELI